MTDDLDDDNLPVKKGRGKALSDDERVQILGWVKVDTPISEIARNLGRSRQCVHAFLSGIKATGVLARAEAESQAANMVRRVIKEADVDQTLEVLDRIDVLPKKERGAGSGHAQFIVMVGMPGQPALVPPSQAEIVTVQQRRIAEKTE